MDKTNYIHTYIFSWLRLLIKTYKRQKSIFMGMMPRGSNREKTHPNERITLSTLKVWREKLFIRLWIAFFCILIFRKENFFWHKNRIFIERCKYFRHINLMRKVDLGLLSQLKVEEIPMKIDFSADQNDTLAIVQSTS